MTDLDAEALDFFLADMRRQGLSRREYQRRYGIMLMSAERDIAEHETLLDDIEEQAPSHCKGCERRDNAA